jgi:hypothetical protein
MYERPKLINVGDAAAVILGISALGYDPDTRDFPIRFEYVTDSDTDFEHTHSA